MILLFSIISIWGRMQLLDLHKNASDSPGDLRGTYGLSRNFTMFVAKIDTGISRYRNITVCCPIFPTGKRVQDDVNWKSLQHKNWSSRQDKQFRSFAHLYSSLWANSKAKAKEFWTGFKYFFFDGRFSHLIYRWEVMTDFDETTHKLTNQFTTFTFTSILLYFLIFLYLLFVLQGSESQGPIYGWSSRSWEAHSLLRPNVSIRATCLSPCVTCFMCFTLKVDVLTHMQGSPSQLNICLMYCASIHVNCNVFYSSFHLLWLHIL